MSRGKIKVSEIVMKTVKNLPTPYFSARSGNLRIVGIEKVDRENTVIWYSMRFARKDLNLGIFEMGVLKQFLLHMAERFCLFDEVGRMLMIFLCVFYVL